MEKKQTAVEWLAEQLVPKAMLTYDAITYNAIQQAKQMEKEQIVDAYTTNSVIRGRNKAKQYYNETYGGQDETL
jgi:hypothetical protein